MVILGKESKRTLSAWLRFHARRLTVVAIDTTLNNKWFFWLLGRVGGKPFIHSVKPFIHSVFLCYAASEKYALHYC